MSTGSIKDRVQQNNTELNGVINTVNELPDFVDTTDATANANDVILNKTAYVNGQKITGIMPNNGALNYTPATSPQSIPSGYTSGGTISAVDNTIDNNITQANIRSGVTILGVTGNLEPDKPDQTKTCIPSTSQQVIEPDNGYELASVTVNAVTSSIDSNITAENIKKDITILGVTGTLEGGSGSGDVKLFETEQEMQADSTAQAGDLAIVYRNEIQNITSTTEFNSCIFPSTVVLPEAFTGDVYCMFRSIDEDSFFDGNASLSSSGFMFEGHGDEMVNVNYTSSDGITYTRTDGGDETINFGTTIKFFEEMDPWNNAIGYFMRIGMAYFGGLYSGTGDTSGDKYKIVNTQLTAISDVVYANTFMGANGVSTGTMQNITNVSKDKILILSDVYSSTFTDIITLDSSITTLFGLFKNKTSLVTIPLFDTSRVTNMANMFEYCTSLVSIPLIDTSNVTTMQLMFYDCESLTSIPLLDTSNVTNMITMFGGCTSLTTIPLLNTSKVIQMGTMFGSCTSLISIPAIDTSNVTNAELMFSNCTSLTTVPILNTSKVTNMSRMFKDCSSLSNDSLDNILVMCANSKITSSSSKTLKYIGLTQAQAQTCTTLSNYSAFTSAGWKTGY